MKRRSEWEKKGYSYINNKHADLNKNVSPLSYDKNTSLLNQSINKLFHPIINSIHLQDLTIKNKNKQIKQNLKEISKLQKQINDIQSRHSHKKEEILLLQEKIKQKQQSKNEVTNLYFPYFTLLEDNNHLLNQHIEELFKKEIQIHLIEKALNQLFNINKDKHQKTEINNNNDNNDLLASNNPSSINNSNRYKEFMDNINKNPKINKRNYMNSGLTHTFQTSQLSAITKHNYSIYVNKTNNNKNKTFRTTTTSFDNEKYTKENDKIKKTSSVPFINFNKEQLEIMNKTFLNEEDFSKILSDYKSKTCSLTQNCKTPSQRQSISKVKSIGKENQINDSSFNNSIYTGHNSKESGGLLGNLGSSFYSQIKVQTPLKANYLKKRKKGINSSKEKLKEYLITENKANFSMCTDDKFIKEGINSSPDNNINKSNSSAVIQKKHTDNNYTYRIYRHAKSLQKNSIEMEMINTNKIKKFLLTIMEIIHRKVIKVIFPLLLLSNIIKEQFVLKILNDTFIKKYYIKKVIEILKECIHDYNQRILKLKEEISVDDFFNENEEDISSSSENLKFSNYVDKLNKFKQLTYEMKEIETNMKEFIDHVYDNE